jgi:hypothetical protein
MSYGLFALSGMMVELLASSRSRVGRPWKNGGGSRLFCGRNEIR